LTDLNIKDLWKNKRKIQFHKVTAESVRLGILLAIVGGFLDAYTFVGRGGVFANAQTGNIVLFAIEAAKRNWGQALVHVPPILAFIAGVVVAEMIRNATPHPFIRDFERAVLILEIVVLFIIGFIPDTVPDNFVTVVVSFVSSVQISSFRKLVDAPYSTTMTTGNLRTASEAAYIALTKKDRKAAIRAIRYFMIIAAFISGAFSGGMLTFYFGVKAIWATVIVLICSVMLFEIDERKSKDNLKIRE
jgi:uncharacterized membrane protein YoaK (UPF0700 family)